MKLSFITDEVTQNFDEAIDFAIKYGFHGVELRSINNLPIHLIPHEQIEKWKVILQKNNLQVISLASSFYKCSHKDATSIDENLENLKHLCITATILDCPYIRGFSFFSTDDTILDPEVLKPYFIKPEAIMKQYNKILLLEADPSVNTTNHYQLSKLLALINSPYIRGIYDPGNDIYDPNKEVPFPDGYNYILPYMSHIHIKDAILLDGIPQCVKVGCGAIDYPALLSTLIKDGYNGFLSLETHYRKNSSISEEQMKLPQGNEFSNGGLEATAESVESLKELLRAARGID